MLRSDELEIEYRRTGERLNELANMDAEAYTDEQVAEAEELQKRSKVLASQIEAAKHAEAAELRNHEDGEQDELADIERRCSISRFLNEGARGVMIKEGPEVELRAARLGKNAEPGMMPFSMLLPTREAERRADAATSAPARVGVNQADIMGRVFASTGAAYLGVMMPMVPVGDAVYPVVATGAPGNPANKGDAVDAAEMTFNADVLSPKRITARYCYAVEDTARFAGLEDVARNDLRGILAERLDAQVIAGDGAAPNFPSFISGLTAAADPGAAVSTIADFIGALADSIDGRYATNLKDVRLLMGAASYSLAAKTLDSVSHTTIADYLIERSGGVRASAHVPAPAGGKIQQAIASATAAGEGNAVAPIWEGLLIERDATSKAASGQIAITAHMLANFEILRSAAYAMRKFRVKV